jgi:hypothetical protein
MRVKTCYACALICVPVFLRILVTCSLWLAWTSRNREPLKDRMPNLDNIKANKYLIFDSDFFNMQFAHHIRFVDTHTHSHIPIYPTLSTLPQICRGCNDGIIMGGICRISSWDRLVCDDVYTKFHEEWFIHSKVYGGGYAYRHMDTQTARLFHNTSFIFFFQIR